MFWNNEASSGVGAGKDNSATIVQVLVTLAGDKELTAGVDGEDAIELLLCGCQSCITSCCEDVDLLE